MVRGVLKHSVAALVGCALLVAACDHAATTLTQPSGPASNPGLPSPQLTVRVDSRGSSVAIVGVSEVTFDARGTPRDKLRYDLQFGDGTSASTPVATHVYATAGTFTATLTATDAADRRMATSVTVLVKTVTGTWFYSDYNEGSRRAEAHRIAMASQDGATLRGVYSAIDQPDRVIIATVDAERKIQFEVPGQDIQFDGVVPGDVTSDLSLTVRGHRINGQTLTFRRAPGEATGSVPSARLLVRLAPQAVPFDGAAVMGLTAFVFDASASIGDNLTFVLEFGDGEYTREVRASHAALRCILIDGITHGSPQYCRTLTARIVTTDRFGRFDVATQNFGPVVRLRDGPGGGPRWFNSFKNSISGSSEWRELYFLSHEGRSVSGPYRHPDYGVSPFSGTFDGAGGIELTLLGGGITFKGKLVPATWNSNYTEMELTLRGGSADGMTLRFTWDDGQG